MRSLVLHRYHDWTVMEQNHLSAAEIAGFIDHTLEGDVRASATEHLATCERCRDEVAACARLASSAPSAVTRPAVRRIVMGVAAVLLVAVALRPGWLVRSPLGRERDVTAERSVQMTSRITTVFPADSVPIVRSQLRFVWKADAGASDYSLTITDANGKTVYAIDEIGDTTLTLPDTVRLTPSVVYFWHVDAPHVDGSSAGSSSVSFRVAP
jgi:hypothetical protein